MSGSPDWTQRRRLTPFHRVHTEVKYLETVEDLCFLSPLNGLLCVPDNKGWRLQAVHPPLHHPLSAGTDKFLRTLSCMENWSFVLLCPVSGSQEELCQCYSSSEALWGCFVSTRQKSQSHFYPPGRRIIRWQNICLLGHPETPVSPEVNTIY